MAQCKFCKKETDAIICHSCKIIQKKKNFSDDDMVKYFSVSDVTHVDSIVEIKNSKFFKKDSKIEFICPNCNKSYTGLFKNLKKKDYLLCHQCAVEKSNIEKYGVKNIFSSEPCKQKIKETLNARYGVDSYLKSDKSQEARHITQFNKAVAELSNRIGSYSNFEVVGNTVRPKIDGHYIFARVNCLCKSCNNTYVTNIRRAQRCNKCFPEDWQNGTSKIEKSIVSYIKTFYSGAILENSRDVISPKELDIYLPDLSLAIEFDGDYWHGCNNITLFRDCLKKADEKKLLCEAKNINLITIKECDYLDRPDVFKRFIKDAIAPRTRIFARNCEIKEIDRDTAKEFCDYYHVNGYREGSVRYGLYDKTDSLICVAVFGKHPKYQWECIRLCYKTGISIIGGWEKIRKHFNRPFLHYIDLQYFRGKNVTGNGFKWKKDDLILSRNTMQKNTQLKKYCGDSYDENLSDIENCIKCGFTAIFDCGNDKRLY